MTDIDQRTAFEEWCASVFPGESGTGKEYAWQGWLASASRQITEEMVEAGARALYGEDPTANIPWDEYTEKASWRWRAKAVLSAALGGGE